MKKKVINILLIIMLLCCTLGIRTEALAVGDYSGTFSLTSSQTNLKVGDIFEVDINIDKLNGFSGIQSFIARKNYDSEIFEYQGAIGKNGWEVKGDDAKIVIKRDTDTGSGVIATLKFKVLKVDLNAKIQLTELDASGEDGDVYYDDNNVNEPTINLKVEDVTPPTEEPTQKPTDPPTEEPTQKPTDPPTEEPTQKPTDPPTEEPTQKPTEQPTQKPTQKPTEQPTQKPTTNDKTTSTTKIPQTGESSMVIVLISVVAVIAGFLFIKYKVYSKDIK